MQEVSPSCGRSEHCLRSFPESTMFQAERRYIATTAFLSTSRQHLRFHPREENLSALIRAISNRNPEQIDIYTTCRSDTHPPYATTEASPQQRNDRCMVQAGVKVWGYPAIVLSAARTSGEISAARGLDATDCITWGLNSEFVENLEVLLRSFFCTERINQCLAT